MSSYVKIWGFFALTLALVSGCATTGANRQADIDALNARIAALQGQLSEKDAEIAKLQNQMREESAARTQAENESRMLSQKLDSALSQMESPKAKAQTPASDLK